jgi:DNA polymerase III subunit chi
MSCEVWFYHLEKRRVEQELPGLLQRGLERQISMAVVSAQPEKLKALSNTIWDHGETAFIVHALADEPHASQQLICLCTDDQVPNDANFRFYVEGAEPASLNGLARASILFDGNDETSVSQARALWKRFKAESATIKYWKQDAEGRWTDQAQG